MKLLVTLQKDFRVIIFSNNRRFPAQRQAFFSEHNIEYVHSHKPFGTCEYENAVLIGDKWLTDALYGWKNKIPVFLVRNVSDKT
jgi:predicted HAD superfamily phosphohydrolase YqeG